MGITQNATGWIDTLIQYKRSVLIITGLVLVNAAVALVTITKENFPDINIPILYISIKLSGISPDDAETLLINTIEGELSDIDGLKHITTTASQGHGSIHLRFNAGTDMKKAKEDTQERLDSVEKNLPADADKPTLHEINVALFPIMSVALVGDVDEQELLRVARLLSDKFESVPGVLEAKIIGEREELIEIVVDLQKVNNLGLNLLSVANMIRRNNQLIAAGSFDPGVGRYTLKVPGRIDTIQQFYDLPVAKLGAEIIKLKDAAEVQRTFKDATTLSRFDGQQALTIDISKRVGANILATVDGVKDVLAQAQPHLPKNIQYEIASDTSVQTRTSLASLFNNVIFSTLLVIIVIMSILGVRNSVLVGLTIPCSFLIGILLLQLLGYTLNMVVLFSLIMSVGILVDSAIVVVESADRYMLQGMSRARAFAMASKIMGPPIIASNATTLVAFAPLLFWPDTIGEFMKFLPITLIATLCASIVFALIIIPVVGSVIGRPGGTPKSAHEIDAFFTTGNVAVLSGFTSWYVRIMNTLIVHPMKVIIAIVWVFVAVVALYGMYGKGTNFFPADEPERGQVTVRARGDLSITERDAIVRKVEAALFSFGEIKHISTKVFTTPARNVAADTIGELNVDFKDWQIRRPAKEIFADIRKATNNLIPGVVVNTMLEQDGPPAAADVMLDIRGSNIANVADGVAKIKTLLESIGGLYQIQDSRPLTGLEWSIIVDKAEAAKYGLTVGDVGSMIKLVTSGVFVTDYISHVGSNDKIDVVVRLPHTQRSIQMLEQLRIVTTNGEVALSNLISRQPKQKQGALVKIDGEYSYSIQADIEAGADKPSSINKVVSAVKKVGFLGDTTYRFRGNQENQENSQRFLMQAFGIAFVVMLLVLVTTFNSISQALLILSAVMFSVIGVFIGLMIKGEPFGIVMSGVGIIALSGIVVNNNIILVETFNTIRQSMNCTIKDAILRTCAQRLRPVVVTSLTTIVGLLPLVFQININLADRLYVYQHPSSLFWVQLATTIAGGLAVSTVITMLITPSMLYLFETRRVQFKQWRNKWRDNRNASTTM